MDRNTFGKFCFKLFVRVFFLDCCCFIMCAFAINKSSNLIRILLQLACIIGTIAFIYPICHKQGDIDAPLIKAGHRKGSALKGLYAGLISCSGFIISGLVLLFARIFDFLPTFLNYYKIINSFFFPFLHSIMPTDYTLNDLSITNLIMGLLVQLFIPVICMLAYLLGRERFLFKEIIFYKAKTDED